MTLPPLELEGTWEEIVAQSELLTGRRVRVIVLPSEASGSPEDSFRQGWYEAMTGQTISLSELWEGIDAE